MCHIDDLQITGAQWDANGNPSAIDVSARANGCQFAEFRVFRTQGDATPLYLVSHRPVANGLAGAHLAVTPAKPLRCGDVVWVEAVCETDPACVARAEVRVVCKGREDAECPGAGPALAIQPAVDSSAQCIAGGTYTITLGGTWPAGTAFDWSVGDFPPGITSPTGEHGQSFVLHHPVGAPGRMVIAEVEVPGCPDVQSVVFFPPASAADCPAQIGLAVLGAAGSIAAPADGTTYAGLAPGDYRVRVTSPAGADVSFEWYRDNALQASTPQTPNELLVPGLPAATETTIAVRVEKECCNPLLDTVVLRTVSGGGGGTTTPPPETGTTPPGTGTTPPGTGPTTPPEVTPPNWPCLVWNLLVAFGLIAALLALVVFAIPPPAAWSLPVLMLSAVAILGLGVLLLLVCQPPLCRILRTVAWTLKWAIVLGALIAIASLSLGAFFLVLFYGMLAAAVMWLLAFNGCQEPAMFGVP